MEDTFTCVSHLHTILFHLAAYFPKILEQVLNHEVDKITLLASIVARR